MLDRRPSANSASWPATIDWNELIDRPGHSVLRPLLSTEWSGRRILLTGAGGSIGSTLAQAFVEAGMERLILLDSSEAALFQISHSLRECGNLVHPILGSVTDRDLLDRIFWASQPDTVVHAAAFKHVALMEQNPLAAVRNNTFGTWVLAQAAAAHRVSEFVLISTDKAVDPAGIMGASKRAAELVALSLAAESAVSVKVLRLCNVIGSSGSVAPLMLQQILAGGPVTVTDPNAVRYFITMTDAVAMVQDVIQQAGTARLFAPDRPAGIAVNALAQRMIQLYAPRGSDPQIVFTGLQYGERLHEALIGDDERWACESNTAHRAQGIREIVPFDRWPLPAPYLLDLLWTALDSHDDRAMLRALYEIVPQYQPSAVIERLCARPGNVPV